MGFGDLAAIKAGGGSAVEVVRVEGLGTVIRVVVESIFIEATPVYCDPRPSETLLHATECYKAIGSYGHHQQAEHQGFYACHYLISNIIIIGLWIIIDFGLILGRGWEEKDRWIALEDVLLIFG